MRKLMSLVVLAVLVVCGGCQVYTYPVQSYQPYYGGGYYSYAPPINYAPPQGVWYPWGWFGGGGRDYGHRDGGWGRGGDGGGHRENREQRHR